MRIPGTDAEVKRAGDRRVLGDDHPHVCLSREGLATVLAAKAHVEAAAGSGSGTGGGAADK